MYSRTFSSYRYIFNIKSDPGWKVYKEFLYPDDSMFTWIENNKIIQNLTSNGDILAKPRDISFTVLFKSETDRKRFVEYVHQQKFTVVELDHILKSDMPYRAQISRNEKVQPDILYTMAQEIKSATKKYNGVYGGWVAQIMK